MVIAYLYILKFKVCLQIKYDDLMPTQNHNRVENLVKE